MLDNTRRADIFVGSTVDIVLKKDQKAGILTRGVVQKVLTRKPIHTRGIKVVLVGGLVGRVQKIL